MQRKTRTGDPDRVATAHGFGEDTEVFASDRGAVPATVFVLRQVKEAGLASTCQWERGDAYCIYMIDRSERMALSNRMVELQSCHPLDVKIDVARQHRLCKYCKFEPSSPNGFDKLAPGRDPGFDIEIGRIERQLFEDQRKGEGCHERPSAKREASALPARAGKEIPVELFGIGKQSFGPRQDGFAKSRRHHPFAGAVEDWLAEGVLEIGDTSAECRLRNANGMCRSCKILRTGDSHEMAKLAKIDHTLPLCLQCMVCIGLIVSLAQSSERSLSLEERFVMPHAQYLYAATVLILIAEIIAGRHRGIYDKETWLVTIGCVAVAAVSRPLAAIAVASVAGVLLPRWHGVLAGTPLFWSWIAIFLIAEFCFYWAHRWAHEAKAGAHEWLWKLHRTHHTAKFMNVGVTIRVNAFWSFVVPTTWVIGIATYLGMGPAAGLTLATIYLWNLITHAHFRWDDAVRSHLLVGPVFRALEHVVVSPGIHHSHHGYGRDGGNFRNYAVTLSLFDWMFGTLHSPCGRPWKYGVPGPNPHWAEEVLYPLVRVRDSNARAQLDPVASPGHDLQS